MIEKKTNQTLALKTMSKGRVYLCYSIGLVIQEIQILTYLKHPFIMNIHYAFQDFHYLYLVTDYSPGGDLDSIISRHYNFTEKYTKFLISCILLGLEYIHSKGILHKDIKPSNLLFDKDGYLKLGDFSISEVYRVDNNRETAGTMVFQAPEVICRQNHGPAVDYYAVGVILYEILIRRTPYPYNNTYEEQIIDMITRPTFVNYTEALSR